MIGRSEWSLNDALFEWVREARIEDTEFGSLRIGDGTISETIQWTTLDWPVACSVGGCTNCAAVVPTEEVSMEDQNTLTDEQVS